MVSNNCGASKAISILFPDFHRKFHKTPAIIKQYVGNVFPEAGLRDVGSYSHAPIVLDV
jgi:hypothetical protein